ncbi:MULTISPECIES: SRPBCC family protein [Aquimarina]|nr:MULTISPECIES: SRPBCC family protein [Aquimarina]
MEKFSQKITHAMNVTPQQAWEVISKVEGVDQWFASLIKTCRIADGKRFCETHDGSKLDEDIIEVNAETKTFVYGIPSQEMLPVENIVGTMKVKSISDQKTEVEWSATFDADKENAPVAQEAFRNLWTMGLKDMETFINSKNQ